jgi:hypothetical protein
MIVGSAAAAAEMRIAMTIQRRIMTNLQVSVEARLARTPAPVKKSARILRLGRPRSIVTRR